VKRLTLKVAFHFLNYGDIEEATKYFSNGFSYGTNALENINF
jgi:hypothetical protein